MKYPILMEYGYWRATKLVVTNISRKVRVDDITYVLIQEGDMMPDLIDEIYADAYRLMGREAFIIMIAEIDEITPSMAMELAESYVKPNRKMLSASSHG